MRYLYFLLVCIALISCKKEEVKPDDSNNDPIAPPSDTTVILNCHFNGTIGGLDLEFVPNVLGYTGTDNRTLIVNPSPAYSQAIYQFSMHSSSSLAAIEIAHGSVLWDYSTAEIPSLQLFNQFHSTDTLPDFSPNGISGFEVKYTDNLGAIWLSDPSSLNLQSVEFNNVELESGTNGDFMKFSCMFSCYVFNTSNTDSLKLENATLQGWFKR